MTRTRLLMFCRLTVRYWSKRKSLDQRTGWRHPQTRETFVAELVTWVVTSLKTQLKRVYLHRLIIYNRIGNIFPRWLIYEFINLISAIYQMKQKMWSRLKLQVTLQRSDWGIFQYIFFTINMLSLNLSVALKLHLCGVLKRRVAFRLFYSVAQRSTMNPGQGELPRE